MYKKVLTKSNKCVIITIINKMLLNLRNGVFSKKLKLRNAKVIQTIYNGEVNTSIKVDGFEILDLYKSKYKILI